MNRICVKFDLLGIRFYFLLPSAGIGRTGTYIALDYLLEQAEHQDWLDVRACVTKLRQGRVNMVQTLVSRYL